MVQTRKMNESSFTHYLKQINVSGEMIKARQEEKQALLDEFDESCKRFFFGKISERTLASSVKKTNKELQRLDKEIKKNMTSAKKAAEKSAKLVSSQSPIRYRVTLSGITGGISKNKRSKRNTTKKHRSSHAKKKKNSRKKPKTRSKGKSKK